MFFTTCVGGTDVHDIPFRLSAEKKMIINFWVVYCRENARESRFENQRGKKCPNFVNICNLLTINLLVENIRLLDTKQKC